MKQSGISVDPGQSLQVAVTPTLTTTTEASKRRFAPVDRTCYFEEEVSLKHFPPDADYRFNCLDKLRKFRALCGGGGYPHACGHNLCSKVRVFWPYRPPSGFKKIYV